MKNIRLINVTKTFKKDNNILKILDNINLSLGEGEILTIMGATGCGKTTLLKIIAGLEPVDDGTVCWDGRCLTEIPDKEKQTCSVFEDYLNYSQKKPAKLLLYFKFKQWQRNIAPDRISLASQIMDMDGINLKEPISRKISKGQQHRFDLARYIITDRPVLLFDNPFLSLDIAARQKTRTALKKLLNRLKITSIIVTDNLRDAECFGKRIIILKNGKIAQQGSFSELQQDLKKISLLF